MLDFKNEKWIKYDKNLPDMHKPSEIAFIAIKLNESRLFGQAIDHFLINLK